MEELLIKILFDQNCQLVCMTLIFFVFITILNKFGGD